MRNLVVILGVPVDTLNMTETLDRLEEMVDAGRKEGTGHQVATVNVDFIVKSLRDPELRYLLQGADMATADGMPLVWAARLLGVPLKARVAGADLTPALAARAAERGWSIYLLGAGPGVAAEAARILQERYPGLIIAGIHSPPKSSVLEMDPGIIAEIKACQPDILLVAFGNPKQEKWIGMHGRELGVPVMMGVGGSLDFIAGMTRRAPGWMQRMGLEWLFRLAQEPRRLWRRYAVDLFVFSPLFLQQWWWMHLGQRAGDREEAPSLTFVNDMAVLKVQGRLAHRYLGDFETLARQALERTPHVILDLEGVNSLDSSAIGRMVELARRARASSGEVYFAATTRRALKSLSVLRLDKFFVVVSGVEHALVAHQQRMEASLLSSPGARLVPQEGRPAWLVIDGPRALEAASASRLAQDCATALKKSPFLILDLSETFHLTSAGLVCLAQVTRLVAKQGGELRLANASPEVLQVIRMAGFERVLALYPDLPRASIHGSRNLVSGGWQFAGDPSRNG